MRLHKKLLYLILLFFSFHAKSQITETRWEIISSENFDLYIPKSSDLDYYRLLNDAEKHLDYCESMFDFHLNESIRLVLSRNDNIVKLPVSMNNSKSTEVDFDRHTGYIMSNTNYEAILLQVKNSIVAILFNDLMYGKTFQDRIQSKTLLQVQDWFLKGLSAYCNEPWQGKYDGTLRQYFLSRKSPGFNILIEQNEVVAGYSFWKFIIEKYGAQNIANLLYISHLTRSIENGLFFVYGKDFPDIMKEWQAYYLEIYNDEFPRSKNSTSAVVGNTERIQNISISPDGKWLAGVQYDEFKTKIYCLNVKSRKRTLINTSVGTNDVILRWREAGRINELLYKITATGHESIVYYNPSRNKNTRYFNVRDFDKLLNFDIDEAGNYIFYGVNRSKTYLVFYNGKTQKLETLQKEVNVPDARLLNGIVYYAITDKLKTKIIRYTNAHDTILSINTVADFKFIGLDSAYLYFSSDHSGLNQVYKFDLITGSLNALSEFTHYAFSISGPENFGSVYFTKGIFTETKTFNGILQELDTADLPHPFYVLFPGGKAIASKESKTDTSEHMLNDTLDGVNKRYYFINGFNEEDEKMYQHLLDSMKQAQKENKISLSVLKNYELNFATMKVSLLQLDNTNFFNMIDLAPLSPTGYEYYYSHSYLKSEMALKDILNKYQVLGGFRLSTGLAIGGGYDAYLKFEKNFKRYSLQTSVYYYQKKFLTQQNSILKQQIQSTTFSYNYKYTNAVTLKTGISLMPYWNTILSTERYGLNQKSVNTLIASLNTEFQYSRLKKYGDFSYRGINIQVQPQLYFNSTTSNINGVLKGILKYYKPLYRRVIWSNQVQFCTSGGKDKILNILGGVENWMFARYDEENQQARTENFQLRSFAGAIRGFRENARSGSNSFCINSELRIPIASLISKWPSDRDWYQTLMLIPFADLGSAWNGLNLFNTSNNYSVRVFDYNTSARNITSIEVKNQRQPIIGSFGCGINTRLIGYNVRFDMAFGVEDGLVRKPMYLLSYGTNF